MSRLLGELLTSDQCWEEWQRSNEDDHMYDLYEASLPDKEIHALKHRDGAWELHEQYLICPSYSYYCDWATTSMVDRNAGYEAMLAEQAKQEREDYLYDTYLSEEEVDSHYEYHHLEPDAKPYWAHCVDNINKHLEDV